MKWLSLIITSFLLGLCAYAEQKPANNVDSLFWEKLYPKTGWTLYCGEFFDNKKNIAIEQVYPMSWVIKHLNCKNVEYCRENSENYSNIETDLHNMYPVLNTIDKARADYQFGSIADEYREFFECDFEREVQTKTVEPRSLAKGNIARSMLYMHSKYHLPVDPAILRQFVDWHMSDPPSKDEIRRNNIIESNQGTRNSFIDNPDQAKVLLSQIEDSGVY